MAVSPSACGPSVSFFFARSVSRHCWEMASNNPSTSWPVSTQRRTVSSRAWRNIDHLPLLAQADRQTQCRVLLALLATAVLFSTGSLHADQAAAEQGLIGDALDRLGAGRTFLRASVAFRGGGRGMRRGMGRLSYLLYVTITDMPARSKRFSNANLPAASEQAITRDQFGTYCFNTQLLAESLAANPAHRTAGPGLRRGQRFD